MAFQTPGIWHSNQDTGGDLKLVKGKLRSNLDRTQKSTRIFLLPEPGTLVFGPNLKEDPYGSQAVGSHPCSGLAIARPCRKLKGN